MGRNKKEALRGRRMNGNMPLPGVWVGADLQKVPETWDEGGSQDSIWVILATISNSGGDRESEETTSRSQTGIPVEG